MAYLIGMCEHLRDSCSIPEMPVHMQESMQGRTELQDFFLSPVAVVRTRMRLVSVGKLAW